jgi:hypothetical protein
MSPAFATQSRKVCYLELAKLGNIRRFGKIPAHKLYPARVRCESLFQLENARNKLIACMHGDESSIFGEAPELTRVTESPSYRLVTFLHKILFVLN